MGDFDSGMEKNDFLKGEKRMNVIVAGISPDTLTAYRMHAHAVWELVVFLKGSGIHTVGEKQIRFQPGTIVCQPPDVPHGTVGDGEYQDMYVQLEGFAPPVRDAVPVFEDDGEKRFETLLRMLYQSFHTREGNWRALVNALSEALCQLLICRVGGSRDLPPEVDSAVRTMVLNIANADFQLENVIENSGYCADHFRRRFREATGQTPSRYMISLRMEHAKRLLSGGHSVRQAALMSGYRDPYYFSKLFRQYAGVSPTGFASRANEEMF